MQLFSSPTSPFARKVNVLLAETGQQADVEVLGAAGSPLDSSKMPTEHNPLGKIPTLVRPEGLALFDSRVICQFLDDRAGGGLYPAAPRLWDCLALEAMSDGVVDAAILIVYESKLRTADMQMQGWVDGQWSKVARALGELEGNWMAYLSGPFDMGQVALGCALSYLDFRHGARNWREGHPNLAAWESEFAKHDSMIETVPKE